MFACTCLCINEPISDSPYMSVSMLMCVSIDVCMSECVCMYVCIVYDSQPQDHSHSTHIPPYQKHVCMYIAYISTQEQQYTFLFHTQFVLLLANALY